MAAAAVEVAAEPVDLVVAAERKWRALAAEKEAAAVVLAEPAVEEEEERIQEEERTLLKEQGAEQEALAMAVVQVKELGRD